MRLNNKKAQVSQGIMWIYRFIIIALIFAVYVFTFMNFLYSKYDIRYSESSLLAKRVTDCITSNGVVSDFDNDKIKACSGLDNMDKEQANQHYVIATLTYKGNSKKAEAGNADLAVLCGLKGNTPACVSQDYYVLSSNEGAKLNVLAAVSKIEERYMNV